MKRTLSDDLLARLSDRAADPARRSDAAARTASAIRIGVAASFAEAAAMIEAAAPGDLMAAGQAQMMRQMPAWGTKPLYVERNPDGTFRASTDNPADDLVPVSEDDVAALEDTVGRQLPGELFQLYTIADGRFGPGLGDGLSPLADVRKAWVDLRRRGPGYTGEAEWPEHLVPIAELMGPVSYDLDSGAIVGFDDYWYDHDKAIGDAFEQLAPDLATWLEEWLAG
jgi:hypothetical protein